MSQTRDGGKPYRYTEKYSPPIGPRYINNTGPGLRGGENFGNGQKSFDDVDSTSGSPGNHGTNHGNGQQGEY